MATNIPPHHLGEVVDATIALIDDPDKTVDELCELVLGPDFPTGGTIFRYETRRNPITGEIGDDRRHPRDVRPRPRPGRRPRPGAPSRRATRAGPAIVVTELPYQVNKATLMEKIAELVKAKRIEGISDLRDESDRDGMRMYIELAARRQPAQGPEQPVQAHRDVARRST